MKKYPFNYLFNILSCQNIDNKSKIDTELINKARQIHSK